MINRLVFLLTFNLLSQVADGRSIGINVKSSPSNNLVHPISYYTANYDRIKVFLLDINAALKIINSLKEPPTQDHIERVRLVTIQLDYLSISLVHLIAQRKLDPSVTIYKKVMLWNRQRQESNRIDSVRKALASYVRKGETGEKEKVKGGNSKYLGAYKRIGDSVMMVKGMADWCMSQMEPPKEELQILRARLNHLCDEAYEIGYQCQHDVAVLNQTVLYSVKQQLLKKITELLARISVCLQSIQDDNKALQVQNVSPFHLRHCPNVSPTNPKNKQNLRFDRPI